MKKTNSPQVKDTKIKYTIKHRPEEMQLLLNSAIYKKLNDGTWFAEIPSCKGVWANNINKKDCEKELKEVLEDWLALKPVSKSRQQTIRPILDHSTVAA
jgi:predicted RNase H-like HicB family nuclease